MSIAGFFWLVLALCFGGMVLQKVLAIAAYLIAFCVIGAIMGIIIYIVTKKPAQD